MKMMNLESPAKYIMMRLQLIGTVLRFSVNIFLNMIMIFHFWIYNLTLISALSDYLTGTMMILKKQQLMRRRMIVF